MHKFPLLSLTEILQNLNTSLQWENAKKEMFPLSTLEAPILFHTSHIKYLMNSFDKQLWMSTMYQVILYPPGTELVKVNKTEIVP